MVASRTIAAAYIQLRPEHKFFIRDAQRPMQRAGTSVGGTFGSFFAKAFAAVAAIGAAAQIKSFLTSSIGAASDLNETVSKVGVVFGGASQAVVEFSKTAKNSIGQSQQSALDAAATFGVFGKSAGLTGKNLSDFSLRMVKLTSDMASFSNTTPEEAIEAVGAALRGESEPIRRYGVLLDDATLRQAAFRLGITKTTKEALTPAQKVLAAQAEILRQTKDAQGDFSRTASGAANQQRILNAQWADAKTKIGAILLPAWQSILTMANTQLIPLFEQKIVPAVQRMGEAFSRDVVPRLREFAKWVKDEVLPRLREFSGWVEAKVVPVVVDLARRLREDGVPALNQVRQAIADNRPQLEALWNGFRRVVDFIVEKVVPVLGPLLSNQLRTSGAMFSLLINIIGFVVDKVRYLAGVVSWFVGTQITGVRTIIAQWQKFTDFIRGYPGQVKAIFAGAASWLYNAGRDIIQGLWNGILSMAAWFRDKIGGFIVNNIPGPVRKILGLGSPSRLFAEFGRDTIRGFVRGMEGERGQLAGAMAGAFGVPRGGRSGGGGGYAELIREMRAVREAVERVAPGVGKELMGGVSGARQLARAM